MGVVIPSLHRRKPALQEVYGLFLFYRNGVKKPGFNHGHIPDDTLNSMADFMLLATVVSSSTLPGRQVQTLCNLTAFLEQVT